MSERDGGSSKYLVIIDGTEECETALLYAAKRAERTNAAVVALVVAPETEFQHWLGVENLMREEAEAEANDLLDKILARVEAKVPAEIERRVIIAGRSDGIRQAIEEDPAIGVLVLAAADGSEGPGPLVSAMAGRQAGGFPIPITIVPGGLSEADIDAIL